MKDLDMEGGAVWIRNMDQKHVLHEKEDTKRLEAFLNVDKNVQNVEKWQTSAGQNI